MVYVKKTNTYEEIAEKFLKQNKSVTQFAKDTGIGRASVVRALKATGTPKFEDKSRHGRRPYTAAEYQDIYPMIIEDIMSGMSSWSIGKKHYCDPATVRHIAKRCGLKLNRRKNKKNA